MLFKSEDSYLHFARRRIEMWGDDTDTLVKTGRIITPYPHEITQENFSVHDRGYTDLLVFLRFDEKKGVCVNDKFAELGLDNPTTEHAIRFVSQFKHGNKYEVHKDKKIIFVHTPYTVRRVKPNSPQTFIASIWREEKGRPELCLYNLRDFWELSFTFVGVATHLRQTRNIITNPSRRLALTV